MFSSSIIGIFVTAVWTTPFGNSSKFSRCWPRKRRLKIEGYGARFPRFQPRLTSARSTNFCEKIARISECTWVYPLVDLSRSWITASNFNYRYNEIKLLGCVPNSICWYPRAVYESLAFNPYFYVMVFLSAKIRSRVTVPCDIL